MLLQYLGNGCKLPTQNSEEPILFWLSENLSKPALRG
jgi:hypothetical protein